MFTGEYVTFIDSDDYVSPDMISLMLTVLKQSSCQIVQCEFVRGRMILINLPGMENIKYIIKGMLLKIGMYMYVHLENCM